ncbi:hypothetical protein C8034_v010781 [Colletotrichum sidae]|uniref:Uncharacterized protein n=1 Tax=Colletotrichum sidae TaxID=1347389 RepID=A0A4R8TII2_9PEZI|nr:hypothetical protein C8034_v010781 [Colletotrichum sidae]
MEHANDARFSNSIRVRDARCLDNPIELRQAVASAMQCHAIRLVPSVRQRSPSGLGNIINRPRTIFSQSLGP